MHLKTRTWVLAIALLALALGIWSYQSLTKTRDTQIVEIIQDGVVLEEIDLSRVTSARQWVLEDPSSGGRNTIAIEPGRICILEADCPDQICVQQGWLSDGAAPIVCLPHHLMIRPQAASEQEINTGDNITGDNTGDSTGNEIGDEIGDEIDAVAQ